MPDVSSFLLRARNRLGPAVFGLIALDLAIHLIFLVAIKTLHSESALALYEDHLALSLSALGRGEVWTLLSYGFLHDLGGIQHILFNLLALFFFGPHLEKLWGTRAFLRFFLLSVVGGGLLQMLAALVGSHDAGTVGASAGLMALLAAFCWRNPDARVLLFFVVPVQARYLLPIVLGIDLLSWLTGSDVAFFAHLGGVLTAAILLRGLYRPRMARAYLRGLGTWLRKRVDRRRRNLHVVPDRSHWN